MGPLPKPTMVPTATPVWWTALKNSNWNAATEKALSKDSFAGHVATGPNSPRKTASRRRTEPPIAIRIMPTTMGS